MKKILLFGVIGLLISVMGGCEKDEEKTVNEYYDCETDRPIYKTLEAEPVIIEYSEFYKVFVIMLDDPTQITPTPVVPCGNSLPKEYQKEGLKVKVSGVCRNCTPVGAPNIRTSFLFKINITSIKKQ